MSYFIDSGLFIGAFYQEDQYHMEAKELLQGIYHRKCYTSAYVLDEFISYLTGKARGRDRKIREKDYENIRRGENIIQDSQIILLQVDEAIVAEAKASYNRYWDLGLDLTDWTTAALMNRNKITNLASFDSGFDRLNAIKEYSRIRRIH